ncbi:MAG: holdfast attachment protein HfaA [Hyphomonadaceae bacterium]|nr:MAG: holdfast attachment protein HfaA [Hyphomonadaceae bacterium]
MRITQKVDENGISPFEIDYERLSKAALILSGAAALLASTLAVSEAKAQPVPGYANEFSRPYGLNPGDTILPYDARTRDLNANRTIVNGVIVTGDSLSSTFLGLNTGTETGFSGTGYAIGNQLNVTTSGSFNTVVVNSSQINNGNQTVTINNGVTCASSCATTNSTSSNDQI